MSGYEILDLLGQGSYGVVHKVRGLNKKTGQYKIYAMKIIDLARLSDEDFRRTKEEAKTLGRFRDHPNIAKLQEAYIHGREVHLVMKYYSKGDLLDRINSCKTRRLWLTEQAVIRILTDILNGLSYLHNHNCIHRDLKPENIFIDNYNRCAIGDFGFSKVVDSLDPTATSSVGSKYYIAPEIMRHEPYDNKVDMFSLGCILYVMCTHTFAFTDSMVLCTEHRGSMIPNVAFPSIYDPEVRHICSMLLEFDPHRRPTADELLTNELIQKFLNGSYDEVPK